MLKDLFTKSVDAFIGHRLQDYRVSHPHADLANNAFFVDSLLAIQKSLCTVLQNNKVGSSGVTVPGKALKAGFGKQSERRGHVFSKSRYM